MQGDVSRVIHVFRQVQVNMLYRLFRDSHQALKGESPEVRKQARAQLIGMTGSMMVHAGITGTWGYALMMLLAGMFFEGGSDEAEEELKNAVVSTFGAGAGGLLLKGVPGHLTGTDLTKDLCMTPFRVQDEGSACLGWRSGGPGPNAPTSHETQPLQRVGPFEAPAGGQAGAARWCRRAGDIGDGACYAEVFMKDWRWPSCSPREIASKGEGELLIDEDALDKLQALRNRLGKPLVLTSAYRSPAHNKRVGGAKNSRHMQGDAFDVRMENHDPHEFESAARAAGFTGFGYYPKSGFLHIDTGPARSWGTPWPITATSWPPEARRQPETITEDRQAQAVAGAGLAGGIAAAVDYAPLAGSVLGNLAPTAQLVAVVVAAALLGYVLWKRAR